MNTTPISSAKQAADAADFAAFWRGKGYEKGQTQPYEGLAGGGASG